MAKRKQPYRVNGPSAAAAKKQAPWCCKWWETTTDKQGTSEKQRSKWFPTKAAAVQHGEGIRQRNHADIRELTDIERALYFHFIKECEARKVEPKQVFYAGLASIGAEIVKDCPLQEATELFYIWMQSEDYSPNTIKSDEVALNWLMRKTDPQRFCSSFTSQELVGLVKGRYENRSSQQTFLKILKAFFAWAARSNYCSATIATHAKLDEHQQKSSALKSANRRIHRRRPRLTVPQIETIFRIIEPRFHPVFALGIFAGLRPQTELMNVHWAYRDHGNLYGIDFEQRVVNLHEDWVTKTRMERTITDLPDSFWRIMEAHKPADLEEAGRISPANYTNWRKGALLIARDALKMDKWPTDMMRHTMCSFDFIRLTKELAMKNAGHKNAETFDTHYLNAVSQSEAEAYANLKL